MLCQRIYASYSRQKILENVDIDLSPGECGGSLGQMAVEELRYCPFLQEQEKGKKEASL